MGNRENTNIIFNNAVGDEEMKGKVTLNEMKYSGKVTKNNGA